MGPEELKKLISKILPFLVLLFFFGPLLKSKGLLIVVILVVLFFLWRRYKGAWPDLSSGIKKKEEGAAKKIIDGEIINNFKNMHNAKNIVLLVIAVIFGLWLFFASIQIVDAGETGVYSLFGKVKDEELRSGFHLIIPLAKLTKMSIRTEEYTMSIAQGEGRKAGDDAITSLTKEGLSVDLDLTVLYRLAEEKASDVYRELGLNYDEKVIRPTIRTAIRDAIAQYEAKDIYSDKRNEVAVMIEEGLKKNLDPRGIVVESILLRNVNLPANLAEAIQAKLQAEQEAQKYDFVLQKEKKEKERKVIEAEGQRDAQKIINESLTANYLYYLYIRELKDRQGTIYVPTSPTTGMPLFQNIGR
ncbi:MAG: prohibitin family protein [Planctomycetes bacterium]|jgi:regulator of protease activity HflC (stomatin/prohibitin superfamily)|nr:prohibitin family protein [Planctomycetota bacterium]